MANSLSILPLHWDIDYIMAKANLANHFGYEVKADGIHFRYLTSDYDAVQAVITAYPTSYTEVMKPKKWEDVKKKRDAYEAMPAQHIKGPIDTDDRSKIKILGLVSMAQLAIHDEQNAAAAAGRAFDPALVKFSEEFTFADNSVGLLTAFDAIGIGRAAGQYISVVHARARELRAQINAAADIDALLAIDINAGWPVVLAKTLILDETTINENTTPGVPVGYFTNRTAGSTVTLLDDALGRFAINGDALVTGATNIDYEAGATYTVVMRETHPKALLSRDTTVTITAIDVVGA